MGIEASRLLAVIDGDATGAIRAYEAAERKGKSSSAAMEKTGRAAQTAVTMGVTGVAVAFGAAVATAMDFDKTMSSVQAKANASQSDFAMLREEAIKLGADTVFTSSQAAAGMDVLAAAGYNARQIFEAIPGATYAAIAAGGDFAGTTEIMSATQRQFNLAAGDFGHIGDVLAKGANVSNASISDLGVSMRYAGPVAATLGMSLEETTAALALMANQGFKSDMAGTALRMGLMRLANIGPIVEKRLGAVGKGLQDNLRNAPTLASKLEILRSKMKDMSRADKVGFLQKLVGTESAPAFLSLLSQSSTALAKMTVQITDSNGAAKEAADTMTNNLYGSVQQLTGSVEAAGIGIGTALTPEIRAMTDQINSAVNGFNALTPEQQQSAIQSVALAAAFAGGALAAVKLAQGIQTIAIATAAASGPVGLLWAAVGLLGGVVAGQLTTQLLFQGSLGATADAAAYAKSQADALKQSLDDLAGVKLSQNEAELGLKVAQSGVGRAKENTKSARKTFGKGSPEEANAKLAEKQALLGVERAQRTLAEATGRTREADAKAEKQTLETIKAMRQQAFQAFTTGVATNTHTTAVVHETDATKKARAATLRYGAALAAAGVPPSVMESMGRLIAKLDSVRSSAATAAAMLDSLYGAGAGDSVRAHANDGGLDHQNGHASGGRAVGSTRGYNATLHGTEWIVPEDKSANALAQWAAAGRAIGALVPGGRESKSSGGTVVSIAGNLILQVPDGKVSTMLGELGTSVSNGSRRVVLGV